MKADNFDPYQELVRERSPYLFCDVCMFYPIEPVHGHFMCPSCRAITKCCEGGPIAAQEVTVSEGKEQPDQWIHSAAGALRKTVGLSQGVKGGGYAGSEA